MIHILIVEDEWLLYNKMADFFKENEYSVADYANSYTEAMKRIGERRPDIALLDIDIEGTLNGIQVGETLNKEIGIPLVYISGLIEDEVIEAAKKTNPNTYLVKSKTADLNQMLITVKMALQKAREDEKKSAQKEKTNKIGFKVYDNYIKELRKKHANMEENTLAFDSVQYIMTDPDQTEGKGYLILQTKDEKQCFQRNTIRNMKLALTAQPKFKPISQSVIINIDYITGMVNRKTIKVGNAKFKVSDKYIEEIRAILKDLFI